MTMEKDLHCSFCGKEQKEVEINCRASGYICNECIELCHDMLSNEAETPAEEESGMLAKLPTPHEIRAHLDDYIGQDHAKKYWR